MYSAIDNLTPNVQFLVDPPDVVHLFHFGPSVHMPIVLDGKQRTWPFKTHFVPKLSPFHSTRLHSLHLKKKKTKTKKKKPYHLLPPDFHLTRVIINTKSFFFVKNTQKMLRLLLFIPIFKNQPLNHHVSPAGWRASGRRSVSTKTCYSSCFEKNPLQPAPTTQYVNGSQN